MTVMEEMLPRGDVDVLNNYNKRHQDQLNGFSAPSKISPNSAPDTEEHVAANNLQNYYSQEDVFDGQEAMKRRITAGRGPTTEIQQFYKDQRVFITGGTGFLGKMLIEKLLRTCKDIDTIYVLIREKKGKDAHTRLHEQLDEFIYHRAHEENPKGLHKVVAIAGDMQLPGLGLSPENRKLITSSVTIILNGAATVKFDEKLSVSTAINVCGTREVLRLARECRALKALCHISTAFSNTQVDHIEEKFYDPPMSVEALEAVSHLDQSLIDSILPQLLSSRPNTYCLTKAVAEDAVRRDAEGMPVCIVRPSIIISTYEEPVRGWTDSVYGPTGLIVGCGTGVLRTMYMDSNCVADMVPVDMSVNVVLASAWYTAKHFKENQTSDIPIYNFVSGAEQPITWEKFVQINKNYSIDKPTTKAVWYYGMNMTSNYYLFLFYNFFLHYLPALLVDIYCACTGKRRAMLKLYNRVMKIATILFYFSTRDWKFSNHNVQNMWKNMNSDDKTLFFFNMKDMSWDYMAETFLVGIRVYLVKDDLSTLPEARKRWNRLYYMHQTLKLTVYILVLYIVYYLLTSIYSLILS